MNIAKPGHLWRFFLAGGTDLIIQMRRGKVAPRHVLSLHRVPGLDRIEANGAITLGALVRRLSELLPSTATGVRAAGDYERKSKFTTWSSGCLNRIDFVFSYPGLNNPFA